MRLKDLTPVIDLKKELDKMNAATYCLDNNPKDTEITIQCGTTIAVFTKNTILAAELSRILKNLTPDLLISLNNLGVSLP